MPAFAYTARDGAGATRRGRVEAQTKGGAATELRRQGLVLLALQPAQAAAVDVRQWLPILRGDIEHGLRQLAVMYRAGMTVSEALDALVEQCGVRVGRLWRAIGARVREGAPLADALARQPAIPALVVQLVRVGEQTGELDAVLERAAETLERSRRLRAAVAQALFYPTIVVVAAAGVAAALVLYLVPKLQGLLGGLGRKLPWSTQMLVDLSEWLQLHGIAVGIGCAGGLAALALIYASPVGRLAIDRLLLVTPIVGRTLRLSGSVQLCRALATLNASGVTMLDSLTTIERLLTNRAQQGTVALARARVGAGESLSPALREGGGFTPLLPQLVATGERTGSLDRVLSHLGDHHDDQLQRRIRWLGAIVEPAMIIVVGAIVGFVYYAFFQAVYGAIGNLR